MSEHLASMGGDTAADFVSSGGGRSEPPIERPLHHVDGPLDERSLRALDAWWRAANYLAVGQIYLMDNPLLREPLVPAHIKPRLLGHGGTPPGLTFLWAHLNRVIVRDDIDALYVTGPGHGGPGVVATAYLEGT